MRTSLLVSLALLLLLAACAPAAVTPVPAVSTSTAWPTETRVPTVTPIAGSVPQTGIDTVLATPIPTYTLFPSQPIYDPLKATQTALAALPTATATPTTPPPTPQPIPVGSLTGGVLGLIPSSQGLWAMRPNGEQMTLITADPIDAMSISPGGRLAVYLTHSSSTAGFTSHPFDYTLNLMTIYDNRTYPIAVIDPPDVSEHSPPEEFNAAVQGVAAYQFSAIAWSPEGGRVAFTSSAEAAPGRPASSDIYTYIPSNGIIHRLTALDLPGGAAHPYDLEWSPDSSRLFFRTAYQFSQPGAASSTVSAGVWVVTMEGELYPIPEGERTRGENLAAWLPGNNLLLSSSDPVCGESNLRSVNPLTGEAYALWPGCFSDMIYDRARSEVVISVTAEDAAADGLSAEGLYVARLNQTAPVQVTPVGFARLYPGGSTAAWYGYQTGQGFYAISRTGILTPMVTGVSIEEQNGLLLRPLARIAATNDWLWSGDPGGVYLVKQGQSPVKVIDMEVSGWASSPSYRGTYFFFSPGENGLQLYRVKADDWQPVPIDGPLRDPGSIRWAP